MEVPQGQADGPLLSASDPAPFEAVNPQGASDIFLVCEHAGRAVPARLGDLGVAAADMDRHIAWDVGAEALARGLSAALNAPLALQRYSRLVIDCNRPLSAPDCIPPVSDGTRVPANANLPPDARQCRYEEIHRPFHDEVARLLDRHQQAHDRTCLVAVHSFTPVMAGVRRHFDIGLLFNRDRRLADAIAARLSSVPGIEVALNRPYSVDDLSDYTIPVHGEQRDVPHVLLEVRSDRIEDETGREAWSALLALALDRAVSGLRDAA